MKKNFSKSVVYAVQGLKTFFSTERHAIVHAIISALVILGGLFFHLRNSEWIALFLAIAMVFAAELFNSAIERLSDTLHPERAGGIKQTKDMAAAAVLVCAIIAIIIGIIIFLPKIYLMIYF